MPAGTTDSGRLVLGLDIGGTSTTAIVADLAGNVVGRGHAAGGNPNTHPPEQAVEEVARAARTALSSTNPARLAHAVLGTAGISKLSDPAVAGRFDQVWNTLGLDCPVHPISDGEVAFAAGTSAPTGTAVISGTGAVAVRITQHRLTATIGGYGWLLGDEGSAFWLGREAVREALRALERGQREFNTLTASVFAELLPNVNPSTQPPELIRKRLITAAHTEPVRLAELAPLVSWAASEGNAQARHFVHEAAGLLADTTQRTRQADDVTPIVLAGSLLERRSSVGDALRAELADRGEPVPLRAGEGAAGAAWLAAYRAVESAPEELAHISLAQLHEHYQRGE